MTKCPTGRRSPWLAGTLIVLLTMLIFLPSLANGFVNWDDLTIFDDPGWMGWGPKNVCWWFTGNVLNDYKPLVWLSYAFDNTFWRHNPVGYHLSNLLFHLLNAFLLFVLLLKIDKGSRIRAAAIAALFFSIHPLRVEAVSWITARKDVLSCFFYLLSLLFYIRFVRRRGTEPAGRLDYCLSLFCALGASLAKPMAVSIPAVLILIDFFIFRRFGSRPGKVLLEKIPYIILSLATAVVAIVFQMGSRSLLTLSTLTVKQRLVLAGKSWLFYLVKTIYPVDLHAIYPKDPGFLIPTDLSFLAGLGLILLTGWFIHLCRKGRRWPLFSWLVYLVALFPVSCLFPSGQVWLADRFSYLPALGISLAVYYSLRNLRGRAVNSVGIFCGGVLLAISLLTIEQEEFWKDSFSLWRRTLAVDPGSLLAHNNLGSALGRVGRTAEALSHLDRAIEIDPEYAEAHNNLGAILAREGNTEEAAAHYSEALRLKPSFERAHYNLGNLYLQDGRLEEAEFHYRRAVEFSPRLAEAHYNLGVIAWKQGNPDEADACFERVVEINPSLRENLKNTRFERK